MRKGTRKLQILDGYRHTFSHPLRLPSANYPKPIPQEGAPRARGIEPKRRHLVPVLTVMEKQLSALLEDHSRIGEHLYDCILQSLYAIESNLRVRHTTSSDPMTHTRQAPMDIAGQMNHLIGEVRHMINELNTGVVRNTSLTTDLHALKSLYEETGKVRITLDLQRTALGALTRDEEREILTIIREALNNCVRHAEAAHATISIRRRGAKIRVQISDDGNGFVIPDDRSRGYGLVAMESCAKKIGGLMRIQSEHSRGTTIIVEFSLEPLLAPV